MISIKYPTSFLALLVVAGIGSTSFAQGVTPSHVYQAVDRVNNELALMHEANSSKAKVDKNAPALTPRRPRHVLQKAREVLLKVQALRQINGLAVKAVPALPVRDVKPADVKGLVDAILADTKDLRAKFSVGKAAAEPALPSGKTPTDVYANLMRASLQVDGLGIPRVVPNDVYQVALTIIDDLEKVLAAKGATTKVALVTGSKGKKPKHVFANGMKLLARIKEITSTADLAIPSGVVMPNSRKGKIRPEHVMDLLNNVLAEIGAIKAKIGVTSPTELAQAPSGKTPSDVFDALDTALAIVDALHQVNSS